MQKNNLVRRCFTVLFYLLLALFITSCSGDKFESIDEPATINKTPRAPDASTPYAGKIIIDLTAPPEINLDFETTEITIQFIPRNEENFPLSPEQVKVILLIDDDEIDREARISQNSQQLAFNVNFGLVLDASYSMVVSHGENEAFTPMLESARDSIQKGIDIWKTQEGKFTFHTTWFNTSIYSSINSSGNQWGADDITDIPLPKEGDFTRLFAATDYAIEKLINETKDTESGPRDKNILLVFSDGQDNFSYVNQDKDIAEIVLTTENGAEYVKLGRDATTLDSLLENIMAQENLAVHVIGMGKDINIEDLQSIANAGNGLYLQNPGPTDIEKPFNRIAQEFTTLQTHGVKIPLKAGDYKFTLRVENVAGSDSTEYSFQFRTGNGSVEIL